MRRVKGWMAVAAMSGMMLVSGVDGAQARPRGVVVRFVLINMSGARREAHARRQVVELPVGERVPMRVMAGESVEISSPTNSRVERAIAITTADEGKVIPVE